MRRQATTLAAAALLLATTACKEEQVLYSTKEEPGTPLPMDADRAGSSAPTSAPSAPAASMPPFARPASGGGVDIAMLPRPADRERLDPSAPLQAVQAPGVVFDAPAGWAVVDVSANAMRANQLTIPGPDGPGELVVFHFGPGQGGDTAANLNRWIGQIDLEPGASPLIFQGPVGDFTVTELYTEGTLKPSTMGVGPSEPVAGSGLYGIIIEGGAQGTLFIKITGPLATLQAGRPGLVTLMESLRAEG